MSSQQYNLSLKNGKAMIDGKLVTTNIYVKDETINLISEKNFETSLSHNIVCSLAVQSIKFW